MRTSLIVVSIVTFATALSGCHVEERDAPKSSVAAPELGYFPVTSRVTLQNNRLFLWREGVTGGQARTVMESGQYLDDLEAELMEISTTASRGEDGVPRYDEGQQARIQEIDSITETLIFAVMENTDLYPNQPSRVSFFPDGGGYGITISNWEYQNYSSVAGDVDDPQQRIKDVSYEPSGGTWRFKLYEPPQAYGVQADYFDFRISRTRIWSTASDGSLRANSFGREHEFYQGDIVAYKDGIVVRRGVAKIMSSASR
jgi:hypothetical protein